MALLWISNKKNVAKRAWKSVTKMLRSEIRDLQIAASVSNFTSRLLHFISRRLIVPFKTRYLQNTSPRTHFKIYYSHSPRQRSRFLEFLSRPFVKKECLRRQSESNYCQIYEYQSQRLRQRVIRKEEKVLRRKKEKEEENGTQETVDSVEDAWRRVVAASPHLRVDERATEFIYRFKKEMKMEKERSLLEFQARLLRS